MLARAAALALLSAAAGCSLDPSGLGASIAFGDDGGVTVTPDGTVQDAELPESLESDAADSAVADGVSDGTSTGPDTRADTTDASDASDGTVVDSARPDTADTLVPDTLRPDTADTSVSDTRDAAVPCTEANAVVYLGHCYIPLVTPRTQAQQQAVCVSLGAHLASITDAGEQGVVAGRGTGDRWIGLVKDSALPAEKTSFRWITGESSQVYDNWSLGDPNGGHDCARMMPSGQWGDTPCTNLFSAVCERE